MTGFSLLDGLVLVAYLAGTTAFGVWLGRRQKDATDYFIAGRSIPWWAVMFSIVGARIEVEFRQDDVSYSIYRGPEDYNVDFDALCTLIIDESS